jgi:hypothetical protein
MQPKKLLHIGCGPKRKDQTLPAFQSDEWREVRFDIDESVAPDIIGTMTDISAVASGSMGSLFSRSPIFSGHIGDA